MVLITGITGLVGSFVAKQFLDKGHQVAGLRRASSDLSLLADIQTQIHWIEGDVLDVLSLEKALVGIDIVVHAAAVVSFAPKDAELMNKVNIEGTANVVNACLDAAVSKMCFISSVAALGRKLPQEYVQGQQVTLNEKSTWEEDPLNSTYAKSKYLAEMEVWRGVAEGLNAVIVNPSVILGEADWNKSSTQLFKYAAGEPTYYPKGTINYIDILDLSACVYQLATSDIAGERFILNAGVIPYQNFFAQIANALGKKAPNKVVSETMSEILWRIEALRSWITGSTPILTKETARSSKFNFYFDNTKIKKQLNFDFRSFEDTITRVTQNLSKKQP
ncbi:NAD-dependent epimerase/dehydratase family protein [Flectobacillus rivi]|uniref:NAD-dependent epimerase/dehydratase family protein n=1 Tax=Flectobacillus rivi TaxID=2984209 RepID=A0ABT6YX58_9BACT|nr:NAD-dependent epimerase/dehydratase family protein [Flectobacillus rivi]MDI9873454.1 NAD-dependent epimerase/dehydratase family protein [Flectobacillus rivi]